MPGQTVKDLIRINNEARQRTAKAMMAVAEHAKIDPGQAVKELDRIIAGHDERLEATRAAMAASAARFESEIKLREERITELRNLQAQYQQAGGGRPEREADLEDITGIGPVAAERLRTAGITSVKALSRTAPARIAEILGTNPDKAAEFITEAKRLLRA